MKLTEKEALNLLWIRDNCHNEVQEEVCNKCSFYEGYCHFGHYLKTQLTNESKLEGGGGGQRLENIATPFSCLSVDEMTPEAKDEH